MEKKLLAWNIDFPNTKEMRVVRWDVLGMAGLCREETKGRV